MKNNTKQLQSPLDSVFNVDGVSIEKAQKVTSLVPKDQKEFIEKVENDQREDYTLVRDNLRNLISEVELVVSDASVVVRTTPNARNYETFSLLIKAYADLNQQLLENSKSVSKRPESTENNSPESTTINNIVFTGTSDSLMDHIKSVSNRRVYDERK